MALNLTLRHSAVAIMLAFILSACSIGVLSDLFIPYDQQMIESRQSIIQGQVDLAYQSLAVKKTSSANKILNQLELARTASLSQQNSQSLTHFNLVEQALIEKNNAADYRLSSGLYQLSSLGSNDNAIPYSLPWYEQVMVYHYQALNYLQQSGLDAALVEIRKSSAFQQTLEGGLGDLEGDLRQYQSALEKIQQDHPDLQQPYNGALQVAYTHTLAGVLLSAAGEWDNAYISYRKALALSPKNRYLQAEVARLGLRLGFSDYSDYTPVKGTPLKDNQAMVVILYEQGLVSPRNEWRFTLPFRSNGAWAYASVALPVMSAVQPRQSVTFNIDQLSLQADAVTNFDLLNKQQLQHDLPWMMTRQVARAASKELLRKEMSKDGEEEWLNALINIYNVSSERADTRSWQTLPAVAQMAMLPLEKGDHILDVSGKPPVTLSLKAQGTTLVWFSEYATAPIIFEL